MRISKTIETALDIDDPISLANEPEKTLLNLLRAKFEGKCYNECLIDKITEIKRRSSIRINNKGANCFGQINVIFQVDALVFVRGEIIVNCKIVSSGSTNGIIMAESDRVNVFTEPPKDVAGALTPGLYIMIVVAEAGYISGSNVISINGQIFMPRSTALIYNILPEDNIITPDDLILLKPFIEKITEEQTRASKLGAEKNVSKTLFQDLVHYYKDRKPNPAPIGGSYIDILDLIKAEKLQFAAIARDKGLEQTEPKIVAYKDAPKEENPGPNVTARQAIANVLFDYYCYLKAQNDFADFYSPKLIEANKNIWKMMIKGKAV